MVIPRESAILVSEIETMIPFLYINAPITKPNSPVVKQRMNASSMLTIIRIRKVDVNTVSPSDTFMTAAIAIGSVLNGLKAIPSIGKNKGAD